MKDKAFLTLSILFFIVFFVGIITLSLEKPLNQTLKASNVRPSPLKSFAIVFPQIGKIGDSTGEKQPTTIKLSVIIRDVNGVALPDRQVKISLSMDSITIKPSDLQNTNNIGQADFFLTSDATGTAQVRAIEVISNTAIENIPSVKFEE